MPDHPAWRSCLSAGHRAIAGTNKVRLTRVTAKLVIRVTACPADVIRRKVQIRTKGGDFVARRRVTGHCRKKVIRYKSLMRLDKQLKVNSSIQSFWTQIPDENNAPSVKLKPGAE